MRAATKLLGLMLLASACLAGGTQSFYNSGGVSSAGGTRSTPNNIVFILLDDWGFDWSDLYGPSLGITPNIDALAATGVVYTKVLSGPSCSPSRAMVLTGLLPRDTGIGNAIGVGITISAKGLRATDPSFVRELHNAGYYTTYIGKFHLAGKDYADAGDFVGLQHSLGFDYFEGIRPEASGNSYTSYTWVQNDGTSATRTDYITTYISDRAIAKTPAQGPFFTMVGFTAPHIPYHCPPDALTAVHDAVCTAVGSEIPPIQPQYVAMLEAADKELQDYVATLNLTNTTVCVAGDNGITRKFEAYLEGTRVPLFCFGNKVTTTGNSAALVNFADLAMTFLEIAGVPQPNPVSVAGRSISFYPTFANKALSPRTLNFTEGFVPNGLPFAPVPSNTISWVRSAENSQYHFVHTWDDLEELYDANADPHETTNLNDGSMTAGETAAFNQLRAKIANP